MEFFGVRKEEAGEEREGRFFEMWVQVREIWFDEVESGGFGKTSLKIYFYIFTLC